MLGQQAHFKITNMHECKICLNTYSDREKLHQHLTESGHFRTSHQLKESGAPPVEFLISMSKRKPKEIELPRICRVCSLSFINQKSLSSHLKKSGHFSSGKRKRNTCNATASDGKGNKHRKKSRIMNKILQKYFLKSHCAIYISQAMMMNYPFWIRKKKL